MPTRSLQGLLALTKKHSSECLEKVCETALSHQCWRLKTIRHLATRGGGEQQQPLPFLEEHPIIRPLADYGAIVAQALRHQADRQQRQIDRRVKAAGFRELKPLDDFNCSFNPSIKRSQLYDLATCRFIREAKDMLLVGPPGTGKSFLAQALGYQAIKQGHLVLYRSIFDVVRDFLQDEAFEGQDRILNKYLKPDLLIIDDMGMKNLPKRSGEFLFEVIMRRYEIRVLRAHERVGSNPTVLTIYSGVA